MKRTLFCLAMFALIGAVLFSSAWAENVLAPAMAPDNTEMNRRDRDPTEPTADKAGMHKSDSQIMASIRKSVMADTTLSTYAHNIKIISKNGKVTLKGPVRSEKESMTIQAKANEVAGMDNVTNELAVKVGQ